VLRDEGVERLRKGREAWQCLWDKEVRGGGGLDFSCGCRARSSSALNVMPIPLRRCLPGRSYANQYGPRKGEDKSLTRRIATLPDDVFRLRKRDTQL
jgi:hypothetical protein